MNWRRIEDAELITELTRRGYVIRRSATPRTISVTCGQDAPANWKALAVEEIRGRLAAEHIDFETITTANEIVVNTASLRVL